VNDVEVEVAWFNPQSEYRPCEYLQQWLKFWPDDTKRLQAAKAIQQFRIAFILKHWLKNKSFLEHGFTVSESQLNQVLSRFKQDVDAAEGTQALMLAEARLTKMLYKIACNTLAHDEEFTRAKGGSGVDPANRFLDHGNYLAYGLGATATWVLGLPHGFSVLHGKTRRGGLVFDAADLIKDALVLPQAFISAMNGDDEQEYRQTCITNFQQAEALDHIIDCLKDIAQVHGGAL
jgi:CRISPR-associated protein Cas1